MELNNWNILIADWQNIIFGEYLKKNYTFIELQVPEEEERKFKIIKKYC